MFELKDYQKTTLEILKKYLEAALVVGTEQAFKECMAQQSVNIPYKKLDGFEDVPYVCLRLPTGGGKTFLAAHSVAISAHSYLEQDFPVVLWLVPTNTIREQTLDILKKPYHPCREAVYSAFDGRVSVFDISEIERIRPQDLTERVCLIVGTLATLRVTNTEGRRIYAHNENFEPHFSRVPQSAPGLERKEDGPDKGKIKFSFANLLHLHQPLVIMDEAHNARTPLTFETLQRIRPACIIEFTATPDYSEKHGSNILYRVSASQLKAEDMIKLPIMLTEHNNWQETIRDAVLTLTKLKETAREEKEFIRPIALIQAESKDREVTVDVVKQHLIENEKIDPEKIAIATGTQRDLDGIDILDPKCKIDYIITIEALKEGWDCPFAYVFCSVANIRSGRDVEQILGRVLRMPYAQKRQGDALNRAYAHVSSPDFAHAAKELRDRLVDMGFEDEEVNAYVQPGQQNLIPDADTPLFANKQAEPLNLTISDSLDMSDFTDSEREQIQITEHETGQVEVVIKGNITDELESKIITAAPKTDRQEVRSLIKTHRIYQQRTLSPAQRGEKLPVPRLCVWIQGELELAEKEVFLDARGWNLTDYSSELSEAEFSVHETARTFEVDVQGKRIVYGLADDYKQLDLSDVPVAWSDFDLVKWLDKQVRQQDIRQEVMMEFLRRLAAFLMEERIFTLASLVRSKYPLAKTIIEKIRRYRQQAYDKGYQDTLFGPSAAVETSYQYALTFSQNNYAPNELYKGHYRFQKHFYPIIGELENSGEEFDCAQALDSLPQVKYWVRNVSNSALSFWLPTSTDKFYPDFVAELTDGLIFVVEYKGKQYITSDDSKEKRNLGKLWEEKSSGKGLFLMAEKKDSQGRDVRKQLMDKIT